MDYKNRETPLKNYVFTVFPTNTVDKASVFMSLFHGNNFAPFLGF
jgi:hypothetical protein